ncbi:xylan glycosyltransferase MUCI21-like [Telopea speciosissima]|uniref:xylan glycosyltransferase MUCI21-like n=1 Tax=Telopea speciosissima TaxID=54955 RepID=UPI001CC4DC8B|nr:xylan glycosyltransferase MUCI21-like [Telopea speciosissima]
MAMAKAKDSKRLTTATALSSMCLILFPLIYVLLSPLDISPLDISRFDHWKQISNWSGSGGDGASLSGSNIEHERMEDEDYSLKFLLRRLVQGRDRTELDTTGFTCKSDLVTDICVANQLVRLDTHWHRTRSLMVYLSSNNSTQPRTVRPYARKNDAAAMKLVRPVEIQTLTLHTATATATAIEGQKQQLLACDVTHDVPAVVFSSGGYTRNLFHDFNDIILPLFITCRQFQSRLKFIVTDYKPLWVKKYHQILSHLSDYEIINPVRDQRIHCFPAAVIGLNYHDNLACNAKDLPFGYSTMDFKRFLHDAFNLKFISLDIIQNQKPLLILFSRQKSRRFLNEDEMVKVADELGFRVIVALPNRTSNIAEFAKEVNSCSVMVGAHGAGLTNAVFLPAGAVLVQVVPLGLEWLSNTYYGKTFTPIGVRYLGYRIRPEESSLLDVYGSDHPVITDPQSLYRKGYSVARAVYLDEQDLKPTPLRFRETLEEALRLL